MTHWSKTKVDTSSPKEEIQILMNSATTLRTFSTTPCINTKLTSNFIITQWNEITTLQINEDIMIRKADKGYAVVVMDIL